MSNEFWATEYTKQASFWDGALQGNISRAHLDAVRKPNFVSSNALGGAALGGALGAGLGALTGGEERDEQGNVVREGHRLRNALIGGSLGAAALGAGGGLVANSIQKADAARPGFASGEPNIVVAHPAAMPGAA